MTQTILNGVSRKMQLGFINGVIPESVLIKQYERKSILLERIQPLLKECGWRYGYNDANGKNACYIIYVYLPNGAQLSWHTNDYYLYKYYPLIDAEWDGQVCMTMEKLLTYIESEYYQYIKGEYIN